MNHFSLPERYERLGEERKLNTQMIFCHDLRIVRKYAAQDIDTVAKFQCRTEIPSFVCKVQEKQKI